VQVQVEQRVERGTPRSSPTRKRQRPLHGVDPLHPHAQQVARACLPMGLAVWDTFVFSNHVRLLTGHCCCNCRCRCCPRRRGKIVQTGGKEGGLAISTCSAVFAPFLLPLRAGPSLLCGDAAEKPRPPCCFLSGLAACHTQHAWAERGRFVRDIRFKGMAGSYGCVREDRRRARRWRLIGAAAAVRE
jgi:hypothetical protein